MDADMIIGWIIAGFVTAGGVLLADFLMGRRKRQDGG
jgi:hypothetical protein